MTILRAQMFPLIQGKRDSIKTEFKSYFFLKERFDRLIYLKSSQILQLNVVLIFNKIHTFMNLNNIFLSSFSVYISHILMFDSHLSLSVAQRVSHRVVSNI